MVADSEVNIDLNCELTVTPNVNFTLIYNWDGGGIQLFLIDVSSSNYVHT